MNRYANGSEFVFLYFYDFIFWCSKRLSDFYSSRDPWLG